LFGYFAVAVPSIGQRVDVGVGAVGDTKHLGDSNSHARTFTKRHTYSQSSPGIGRFDGSLVPAKLSA
jgi:hypothetical protein